MPLTSDQCLRVSARFKSTDSGDVVNVFHFRAYNAISDTDATIMNAVDTWLSAAYAEISNALTAALDPYDIRYDVVDWVAGKETVIRTLGTRTWVLTTPPANAGDAMPSMDAAIINFRSIVPGTFGRKYLGPLVEGDQAAGSLTSTVVTQMTAAAVKFLLGITLTGGTLVPAVMSVKPGPYNTHIIDLAAAVINAVIGSQRRRRKNRGS